MQVMHDLETMGRSPDAPILSIGAVKYELGGGGKIIDAFHVGVTLESSMALGCVPDASTIMFWMGHEQAAARAAWLTLEKVDLPSALFGFVNWYVDGLEKDEAGDVVEVVPVWGYGATFDNVIIANAFKRCNLKRPWSYKDDRCFRTVSNGRREVEQPTEEMMTHILPGVPHDALWDATRQALHHQSIHAFEMMIEHAYNDTHLSVGSPVPDHRNDVEGPA